MKNFKLDLFKFKNSLDIDQMDVVKTVQFYIDNYENFSEIELTNSLKESLQPFTFYPEVEKLLESFNEEINNNSLLYELKDLYKKIDRKNNNSLYTPILHTLLDIINSEDDDIRMDKIFNTLIIYDWDPDIKVFILKKTTNDEQVANMTNTGKSSKVYTLSIKTEDGYLIFIEDSWFLLNDEDLKPTLLEEHVKDENKLKEYRMLQDVFNIAEINEEFIIFPIDDKLNIKVSTKNGKIYLNDEKLDKETSLEKIFQSPIIPFYRKNLYTYISNVIKNLNKFVELDIAIDVKNIAKPLCHAIIIKYNNKYYLYYIDKRNASLLYKYDNVIELINDVKKEFDIDISFFLKDKLPKDMLELNKLKEREKQIDIKLNDVNESIRILLENKELLNENKELKITYNNLLVYKNKLLLEKKEIRNKKNDVKYKLFLK